VAAGTSAEDWSRAGGAGVAVEPGHDDIGSIRPTFSGIDVDVNRWFQTCRVLEAGPWSGRLAVRRR